MREKLGENITDQDIQEFFMNFAVVEVGQDREQRAREFALTDPHPPDKFRVNATLQHVDGFYEAFSVLSADKLYRPKQDRAKIW